MTNIQLGDYNRSTMQQRGICIRAGSVEVTAGLNQTRTAESIWRALPLTGIAETWGDEIYFPIPLALAEENARDIVEVGELGYWQPGEAFCIFFGPTPITRGEEIRAASPVNIFGKIVGDATVFRQVEDGTEIVVERSENG